MIGILRVFGSAFYALNTAATMYWVGRISWMGYKKWRRLQNEKMTAAEIRESFVRIYSEENGEEPSEALIQTVLDAHNATEFPIQKRINDVFEKCRKFVVGEDETTKSGE